MIRGQNFPKHGGQTAFFRMKTHSAGEMFGRGEWLLYVPNLSTLRSEPIHTTFRSGCRYVPKWGENTFRTCLHPIPKYPSIRPEPIIDHFRTYR